LPQVIFSDKSTIAVGLLDDRAQAVKKIKFPAEIMVWGQ